MLELKNFFNIKEEELKVLNPYDFNKSIQRLKNLTLDDIKNDLNNYQKKEFEFRTYEEEVSYSLKNIKFITSSKNDNGENYYYLLKDLKEYFVTDEDFNIFNENENRNKENKKISLEIRNIERGKKEILLIMYVDPRKLSENIRTNFISVSTFDSAKGVQKGYDEQLNKNSKGSFRFTIIIIKIKANIFLICKVHLYLGLIFLITKKKKKMKKEIWIQIVYFLLGILWMNSQI